ncbi:MAG: hypothetical protein H6599_02870 [Flavobacteriales bacterium]|nr:hypothetical protein [Flavobacteriales bacterium]
MNRKFQIVLIIAIIGFLFYLDFLRDYVFKNLDWRMDFQYHMEQGGSPDKYVDGTDSWMKSVLGEASSNTIYLLKYMASGIFIVIYTFISHLIMRLAYPDQNTFPFTFLLYGLGTLSMLLVFGFYFFEWSIQTKAKFYLTSMEIGHFLESSLPTLLMLLGFKIYLSSQEVKPNE